MWSWAIPLASGGSLSVDSAPTSATSGDIGTIDVSWLGLTSGTIGDWYLGAVSHTGDVGLMGLTLVNVDNRGGVAAAGVDASDGWSDWIEQHRPDESSLFLPLITR